MAKSIAISILATSLMLSHLSTSSQEAVIDCTVLRETDKAVMVEYLDEKGQPTGKTSWMPKRALDHKTILGQEVYVVNEWFETLDGVCIDQDHEFFGYMTDKA